MSSTLPKIGAELPGLPPGFCVECGAETCRGRFCADCWLPVAGALRVAPALHGRAPDPSATAHAPVAAPSNSEITTTHPAVALFRWGPWPGKTTEHAGVAKMKNRYLAKAGATALATLIIASGIGSPAQAGTPSPNAINTYSRAAVASAYANQWLPTATSPINWTGDAANCQPGTESADSLAKGAQAVNFYRGLAGLDSISLTDSQNILAQQTALLMEANGQISHNPDASWKCYTQQGAQGAATSNLFGGGGSFYIGSASMPVKAYMDDSGPYNDPVGHRRWVLNPSTVTMGMGTTKGFNALNIAGAPTDTSRTNPTMISFPNSGYFPQQLEPNGKWSLSSAQGVDFSGATVSVKDANGAAMGVIPLSTAEGYGPNTISFEVQGLSYASGTSEADYKVTVDNMKTNNLPFSYSYTVRLFDGTISTSNVAPADPQPTLPTPATPVVPTTPTFGATSYTIPTSTGVAYKVNGIITQAGTYNASIPITITAEAASSAYAVTGETTWSKDFTPVPVAQPIAVTPIAPTFTDTTYAIPYQDGVDYQVNGGSSLQGTYTASTPISITAVALPGYTLTGTTTWSKDLSAVTPTPMPTPINVTPVAPTLGAASYSIPSMTGVDYRVNGAVRAAGSYTATTDITITAVAQTGYVLSGTMSWSKDYTPIAPMSPIAVKVASLNGALGSATSAEVWGLRDGGGYQCFQNGCVLYSPATGAHVSRGAIRGVWALTGFENGSLGYPVTDEVGGLRDGGVYQNYEHGAILYEPNHGTFVSQGAIRNLWAATGFENGSLGYPITNEVAGLKNGGVYQNYERGAIIWSPASGAHTSFGAIRGVWAATGFENGGLGYPVTDDVAGLKDGGVYQNYQGGAIIWSPATGAHLSVGATRIEWAATGFENGRLGYPVTDEVSGLKNGGVYQNYQGGAVIWSPASGAHASVGAIRTMWAAAGFESGRLGYPTSDEYATSPGNVAQNYQGGTITWGANGNTIIYK